MFQVENQIISVKAPVIFNISGFDVTNTMTTALLTGVIAIFLCLFATRFKVYSPSKPQLAAESVVSMLSGFIEQIAGNRKIAWKIMPIVGSMVAYILISNLITTLIPFLGGLTIGNESLFRSSTSDINATLSLSLSMVIISQIYLIQRINIFRYILKFVPLDKVISNFRKGIVSGLGSIIDLFIGVLDLISEFAKVISLSLRLLGNMFAGEILLRIFMGIFAIIIPIPIMMLGGLAGLVQAVVFGALVTSYFAASLSTENSSES